jgi:hypothetical protein
MSSILVFWCLVLDLRLDFLVCSVYLGFLFALFALGGNLSLHLFFEDERYILNVQWCERRPIIVFETCHSICRSR